TPYDAGDGKTTVGWGSVLHDGPPQPSDRSITLAEAEELFDDDIGRFVSQVRSELQSLGVSVSQAQFDALVSYTYNTGQSLLNSQLGEKLEAGDLEGAAAEMDIVTSRDQVMRGLVRRRYGEQMIFLSGD